MPTKIDFNADWRPKNFSGFILYRIYYDNCLVYLGRTAQPLQDRIRGHLFKKPLHREIDIHQVTKIEYATFQSQADQFFYEIYYINLWKPPLNKDDKARDSLTIQLPEVEWKRFETHLWTKWLQEIDETDREEERRRQAKIDAFNQKQELRRKFRAGEITQEEFCTLSEQLESQSNCF